MKIYYYSTASFDVDAQKGFTPICPGELPVPGGDEIAAALNEQAAYAKIRVGSKDAHSPAAVWVATQNDPQFSPILARDADIHWNRHCEVGTEGFELLDGLPHPMDYNFFVYKGLERDVHPYGACYHNLDWNSSNRVSTGVIQFLNERRIDTVIVGGLATDYCVKTTALQLVEAGFGVVVNLKACRGIAQATIDAAIAEMRAEDVDVIYDISEAELVK